MGINLPFIPQAFKGGGGVNVATQNNPPRSPESTKARQKNMINEIIIALCLSVSQAIVGRIFLPNKSKENKFILINYSINIIACVSLRMFFMIISFDIY